MQLRPSFVVWIFHVVDVVAVAAASYIVITTKIEETALRSVFTVFYSLLKLLSN